MLKKRYRYLLFDLDRTIWDFDTNAKENIFDLLKRYRLETIDKSEFYTQYDKVNHKLWNLYEKGELSKEELRWRRFYDTFTLFQITDIDFSKRFGEEYLEKMPYMTALMPHAKEVLIRLKEEGAKMAIISNGFKEVQYKKLKSCGIDHLFDTVMISEEQGVHKPSPIIFKRAIKALGAEKTESLMVGDDFTNDIEGAMIFGIDQFYYNYKNLFCDGGPTYESNDLRDLLTAP